MTFRADITIQRANGRTEQRGKYGGYHVWSALLSAIHDVDFEPGDIAVNISINPIEIKKPKAVRIPVKCMCCGEVAINR